jgi:hypothetical protein
MDDKIMAAITAAIEAYVSSEKRQVRRVFTQRLSRWKMATRREMMSKRHLSVRPDPYRSRMDGSS